MDLIESLRAEREAEKARGVCDDPDCACRGEDLVGDGEPDYSTVTMTEVYDVGYPPA